MLWCLEEAIVPYISTFLGLELIPTIRAYTPSAFLIQPWGILPRLSMMILPGEQLGYTSSQRILHTSKMHRNGSKHPKMTQHTTQRLHWPGTGTINFQALLYCCQNSVSGKTLRLYPRYTSLLRLSRKTRNLCLTTLNFPCSQDVI